MVYDWDDKREACFRMYVQEKKTLEEIKEYFRQELGFAPRSVFVDLRPRLQCPTTTSPQYHRTLLTRSSRRAFQVQFKVRISRR